MHLIKIMNAEQVESMAGIPADSVRKSRLLISEQVDGSYYVVTVRGPYEVKRSTSVRVKAPKSEKVSKPKEAKKGLPAK